MGWYQRPPRLRMTKKAGDDRVNTFTGPCNANKINIRRTKLQNTLQNIELQNKIKNYAYKASKKIKNKKKVGEVTENSQFHCQIQYSN